jgi:RNA polymerase subunit RPABC4/transcription elongation factor Spt4
MKRVSNARRCPFCGSADLILTDWWDGDGEYSAVACLNCKAEAPQKTWNLRTTFPASATTDLDDLPAFLRPQAE